jgi:hypothetical protein
VTHRNARAANTLGRKSERHGTIQSEASILSNAILERAMGIEPTSSVPQVFESTHRSSSIWAHLGAQFRVWTKNLAHFVHCIALRIADHMTINPQRDSRIRVPHLRFRDRRIRSYVH